MKLPWVIAADKGMLHVAAKALVDPAPVSFPPYSPHLQVLPSPMLLSGHRDFLWILTSATFHLSLELFLMLSCLGHSSFVCLFRSCLHILQLSDEMSLPVRKPFLMPSLGLCSCCVLPNTAFPSSRLVRFIVTPIYSPSPPHSPTAIITGLCASWGKNPICLAPHCIPDTQPNTWTQ